MAPAPAPGRRRDRPWVWAVVGIVVLLVGWELWVRARGVKPFVTVEPSRVLGELGDHPSFWLEQTWKTAWHTLFGLGAALSIALAAGAVIAAWRRLEWAAQPVLVLVMVTPWVAYITSVINWVGTGLPTILFMVTFVSVPPLLFAAVNGMRSADPTIRELLASVDTPRHEVLLRLRLPAAMPALLTAARFTSGLALAAAYFAEGASTAPVGSGLGETGRRVTLNQTGGYPILWASIACAALLGVLLLAATTALERRLLGWHASQRRRPTLT